MLVGMETGPAWQVSPQMPRGRTEESVVLTTMLRRTLGVVAGRLTEWQVRILLRETAQPRRGGAPCGGARDARVRR